MAAKLAKKFLSRLFGRFVRGEGGNVMLMTAVVSVPLVAAAGVAVDYGRATRAHQQLQLIADSATLAAASAEKAGGSASDQVRERQQIATSYIARNLDSITDVVLSAAPTVTATSSSVSVTIPAKVTGSLTSVFKMMPKDSLLGGGGGGGTTYGKDTMSIDISVKSKASWVYGAQYVCMLALNTSKTNALSIQGTADINATKCAVYDNSSDPAALYENGNATLTASKICVAGNYTGTGYSPTPSIGCTPFTDPLVTPYANYYAATYASSPAKTTASWTSSGTVTIDPGTYTCANGKTPVTNGQTVNMNPGIYYIKNCTLQVKSGGTINGLGGVTIVLVGNGSNIDIQAGGNLNLKAPASGNFAGIALAQDKNVTGVAASGGSRNSVIGGGQLNITGVVYFPTHDFYVTGNGTSDTNVSTGIPQFAIVADTITIQGNGQVHVGGGSDYNSAGLPALPMDSAVPRPIVSLN